MVNFEGGCQNLRRLLSGDLEVDVEFADRWWVSVAGMLEAVPRSLVVARLPATVTVTRVGRLCR